MGEALYIGPYISILILKCQRIFSLFHKQKIIILSVTQKSVVNTFYLHENYFTPVQVPNQVLHSQTFRLTAGTLGNSGNLPAQEAIRSDR